MKKIINKGKVNKVVKTKNVKEKEINKKDLSSEEIFEQLQSLSSCDCSCCPKNCFDK